MGYHINKIDKGELGRFSKIREEVQELFDADEQRNPVLIINELCDLIGAIEAFVEKEHNITLDDLIAMKNLTKSSFEDGTRK